MSAHRWSKFWWQDWKNNSKIRSSSLAARGFWMELLCIAHEGNPYGHVTINNKPATPAQLAKNAGTTEATAIKLLKELEDCGVFSRTDNGIIYSRRMVRDKATSEESAQHGRRGGNPSLKPKPQEMVKDNGPNGVNPPPYTLEAEAESESKIQPSADAKAASPAVPLDEFPEFPDLPNLPDVRSELWADGLAIVRGLTGKPEAASRGIVGRLAKACRDDCAGAMAILRDAQDLRPAGDPVAWIMASAKARDDPDARLLAAVGLAPSRDIDGEAEPIQRRMLQ
jgi:hypothetical protein